MGTYTDETKVEGVTQFTITESTEPTTAQVAQWITEVEADVDARALSSYTLTDQKIDIPAKISYPESGTIAWLEMIAGKNYMEIANRMFFPPFLPIVSVASLSKRASALTAAESWTSLTEGPGADSDFLIMKKRTKTNQYLGFAIYFYANAPTAGYQRVKMTYNYGWNLSTDIIGEWCTLKVALKVLGALLRSTTPFGSADYGIGDLRVGIDLERRIVTLKERVLELEYQYFPEKKLGIALI